MPKIKKIKQNLPKQFIPALVVNGLLVVFQTIYLALRYKYLNNEIPFWYTKPWGDFQLANKANIYIIPAMALLATIVFLWGSVQAKKKIMRYGSQAILMLLTVHNILLTYALLRIIRIASVPFNPLVPTLFLELILPGIVGFTFVYIVTPKFIEFYKERGLVTDPALHQHPGMLLKQPSARGGGFVFAVVFSIVSILFVPTSRELVGIIIAALAAGFIGILDDIQNTHPLSKLKFLENPVLRLSLQILVAVIILAVGIRIDFINNPLSGVIFLNEKLININGFVIAPISVLVTLIWIPWLMNLLSWSNGIDGQYAGIVGIAGIVIALISLRSLELTAEEINIAKTAIILAGVSFGMLRFTWHPSKIMWGFGAISAGVILATLSIMTRAKIPASIIAILIPFLDAVITIVRRILQKKNPFKADKAHLHHLLLERGWSIKKIAVFYWVSTAILGVIAVLSSDKALPLIILSVSGVIAFVIILLNVKSRIMKSEQQQSV